VVWYYLDQLTPEEIEECFVGAYGKARSARPRHSYIRRAAHRIKSGSSVRQGALRPRFLPAHRPRHAAAMPPLALSVCTCPPRAILPAPRPCAPSLLPPASQQGRPFPSWPHMARPHHRCRPEGERSDLTPIFIGLHRNAPLSPMEEGARVHHSCGSYAPSTYGSYEPRRANPSTAKGSAQLWWRARTARGST
jgi:hypothetical protein